jgi:trehalose synthase
MIICQHGLGPVPLRRALILSGCLTFYALGQCGCTPNPAGSQAVAPSPAKATQSSKSAEYLDWLEQRSMLNQSQQLARHLSEKGNQQRPYAKPQPREALRQASVWLLDYPGSVITKPGESVIATWGDPKLWDAFAEIGISLLHTGPVNRAGGIVERDYTPTIDGLFDPISLEIDPELGTEQEYRAMVEVAKEHHGSIAADFVPLHTGKGADFLLALRAFKNYSGIYTMVEIDKRDWELLPAVASPWKSALISDEVAQQLQQRRYIPGRIDSCDADPKVRQASGWSATGKIEGVDGKSRRWVYLHYFKPGQPVLDWLNPSCTAQQVAAGNVVFAFDHLGANVGRLDAIPFLGIEPKPDSPTAFHFQHPLAILDANYLAFLSRKLGGWTFQELNAPLSVVKQYLAEGPDFSYDFFTRTEGLHALLTGDAELLRRSYNLLLAQDLAPLRLVHDLQNHDEITYQLVGLDALGDETLEYHGRRIAGKALRKQILNEMRSKAAGDAAPYNLLYRPTKDGVATTFCGFIAAALGIRDLDEMTSPQKEEIKRGHLLMAFVTAMQPGVFSVSSWDLVGALPLSRTAVENRLADEDYRWINRGGVDLLGANLGAQTSRLGLPRAKVLYGSLPEQLKDENSFASQLKRLLAVRKKYKIEEAELIAAPEADQSAVCVLVMRTSDHSTTLITASNFSREAVTAEIDLRRIKELSPTKFAGREVFNGYDDEREGQIDDRGVFKTELDAWGAKLFVLDRSSQDD